MTMATTVTSAADPATTTKEIFVKPSIFGGGSSSGAEHTVGGFSGLTGSDFIIGDDGLTCREMVDEFAPSKFFASIHGMEHEQLFTEFNIGVSRQMSLSAEVKMRAEFNIREKKRLCSIVDEKDSLMKARDEEIKSLKARLLMKETEAAEAIHLRAEASKFKVDAMVTTVKLQNDRLADRVRKLETSSVGLQEKVAVYENCMSQLEKFLDEQMAVVHEKFNKMDANFIETCLHLEERFYPHLLTTIAGHRWLLTYGMKLTVFKCLNSLEYLSALGTAINKAIKKGMQDGLAARITHGQEGRVLIDVAAFNPSAEDDFTSALQEVQNVNFSLLAELQSNEDASVKTVMDLLRLDEALAKRLGLNDSQPHVDQLMVLVHHSPDQTVIGARAFSLSLDVSHGRAREVLLVTTTALFVTLASASTIPPISMDDYEIAHAKDQGNAGADVDPFPNVDDAELIIS
ncbi:hypothetical protein Tco_1279752 [Tanacetum coccineum]